MIGFRSRRGGHGPCVVAITDHEKRIDVQVVFDKDGVCWDPNPAQLAVLASRPARFERIEQLAPQLEPEVEPQPAELEPETERKTPTRRRRAAVIAEAVEPEIKDDPAVSPSWDEV